MFGSNFAQQFGLVGPPWDNLDQFSGIFGPNAPSPWELPGSGLLGEARPSGVPPQQPSADQKFWQQQPAVGAPPAAPSPQTIQPTSPNPAMFGGAAFGEEAGVGQGYGGFANPTANALAPRNALSGVNSEFARGG